MVIPVQLMRSGVGRNTSYSAGDVASHLGLPFVLGRCSSLLFLCAILGIHRHMKTSSCASHIRNDVLLTFLKAPLCCCLSSFKTPYLYVTVAKGMKY